LGALDRSGIVSLTPSLEVAAQSTAKSPRNERNGPKAFVSSKANERILGCAAQKRATTEITYDSHHVEVAGGISPSILVMQTTEY